MRELRGEIKGMFVNSNERNWRIDERKNGGDKRRNKAISRESRWEEEKKCGKRNQGKQKYFSRVSY